MRNWLKSWLSEWIGSPSMKLTPTEAGLYSGGSLKEGKYPRLNGIHARITIIVVRLKTSSTALALMHGHILAVWQIKLITAGLISEQLPGRGVKPLTPS